MPEFPFTNGCMVQLRNGEIRGPLRRSMTPDGYAYPVFAWTDDKDSWTHAGRWAICDINPKDVEKILNSDLLKYDRSKLGGGHAYLSKDGRWVGITQHEIRDCNQVLLCPVVARLDAGITHHRNYRRDGVSYSGVSCAMDLVKELTKEEAENLTRSRT